MADTTIDLLKNSSYVGKMDELIAAVKLGSGATSDVEWDNVKNKPTTIGGYGIIDAKIDNGTITLGNQTITPLTSAPVTSVNSKTGAVTLSAADVSAIPSTLTGTAGQVLTKTADGQEWKDVDIPTALPNPNALTFTGAVNGIYDGSEPVTVEIPAGGGTVEDLPVLQSFTIEDDETNIIEFTNLQNLTEFEVEISWTWSSITGISGIALWLKAGFGVWHDQTPILNNGFNRNATGKIVFKGKRLSNTVNNIAIIGGVTGSYSSSCVTRISESETADYIGLKLTTSDVFFVNGTTVILRGR